MTKITKVANIGRFDRSVGILGQQADRAVTSGTSTTELVDKIQPGQVQFSQARPDQADPVRVTCWLNGVPLPTGSGFGGWTVVSRDGQQGLTEFDGTDPERWTVPILLNGWSDDIDQTDLWDRLWSMARMRGNKQPDTVNLRGNVPPRLSSQEWLIETIAPGDSSNFLFDKQNHLLRADATVTLLAPGEMDLVTDPIVRAQKKSGKSGKPRTATVKKGDTLLTIAARVYGNPGRWRDIAAANPKSVPYGDPEAVKAGTTIKLPD